MAPDNLTTPASSGVPHTERGSVSLPTSPTTNQFLQQAIRIQQSAQVQVDVIPPSVQAPDPASEGTTSG